MTRTQRIHDRLSACPGCPLLCDDFEDTPQRDERLCQLGHRYFQQLESRSDETRFWLGRQEVSPAQAVERSREILRQAHAPLVCGLESLAVRTQALAVKIAKQYRGFVDSGFHRPMGRLLAFQETGNVTATLGEIRDRTSLVVFLYADPDRTHPRLWERLNCDRKEVVWIGETASSHRDDSKILHLPVANSQAIQILLWLQHRVQRNGSPPESAADAPPPGAEAWTQFATMIHDHSHIGIIADDPGDLALPVQQTYWARVFRWVQSLNQERRAWVLGLRNDANGLAAENTIAALTGFPRAVSFQSGYPEFEAALYSGDHIINAGMADAMLWVVGGAPGNGIEFSGPKIKVQTSSELSESTREGDVTMTTPFLGAGDWVRFDDVCLPVQRENTRCPVARFFEALLQTDGRRE